MGLMSAGTREMDTGDLFFKGSLSLRCACLIWNMLQWEGTGESSDKTVIVVSSKAELHSSLCLLFITNMLAQSHMQVFDW